ncbi:MAG: C4-dicarboxylate ABC transporter [Halobacteriovoraceae bacterium]|nr:C4-dicarboxylate ABC transporter [Halobacteriovoraceae bacterium]
MEIFLYLLILLAALVGSPIFVVMTLISAVAFHFADEQLSIIAIEIYRMASAPTLLTIPLFTFAGYLMAESKSPERLLKLAHGALGWLPGGVAIVSLVICAFFTAFTGASGVTIIALGGLLYPMLIKENYPEDFTLGLITTSGSLGLLFPPSLPIILYGIVAKVDIDQLFLAGLLPGFLLIVILSSYSIFKGSEVKYSKFNPQEFWDGVKAARFEIPLPFLVLGGIYSGAITPTEASALCAFYVLIMECFLYKDIHIIKDVPRITKDCMSLVGAILLILSCALGLTSYLVDEEIPLKILEMMRDLISSKILFLLFLNVFLLVVGAMMDIFSAIIVVVPLILPIAEEFGVDPIHLAIIFLTNLEIGYITPPVGINLFISSFRFEKSVLHLYKVAIPYFLLMLVALVIITYIPWLSLLWF